MKIFATSLLFRCQDRAVSRGIEYPAHGIYPLAEETGLKKQNQREALVF